jgi:uncharacterized Zn ribbon protein
MKLALCKGKCDKCREADVWLYLENGKLVCEECLNDLSNSKERKGNTQYIL